MKFATPRAKNASAKLGASSALRRPARSGVMPDSQAFEKTKRGMRSTRLSSFAESVRPPVNIQPERVGSFAS